MTYANYPSHGIIRNWMIPGRILTVKCSFDGCNKVALTAGLCAGHNRQRWAGEKMRPLQLQYHGLSEYDRFFKRVIVGTPKQCWPWTGSQMGEWHGQWRNEAGLHELTHRAAWRLMKGEIPKGLFVLHRCDNAVCVNPAHLFLGTQSDNLKDMWAKGRARPKSSLGEKHGMSKLTTEKVLAIRSSSESAKILAQKFGVATTTIYDVLKRKIWKHL